LHCHQLLAAARSNATGAFLRPYGWGGFVVVECLVVGVGGGNRVVVVLCVVVDEG
jgi:hypothetical protein